MCCAVSAAPRNSGIAMVGIAPPRMTPLMSWDLATSVRAIIAIVTDQIVLVIALAQMKTQPRPHYAQNPRVAGLPFLHRRALARPNDRAPYYRCSFSHGCL